ncbi:MAG: PKD domain-containing protein [Bacteroidota bacterium]|nr:PKD domain-containing protein [Bacteroidota bacterium]
MTYTYKGNFTYELNLNVYKDCASPFLLSANQTIFYFSSICGINGNILMSSYSSIIIPACQSNYNECNNGSVRALEKRSYRGTVILTSSCSDYVFQWKGFNRSNRINTINPSVYPIYLEATLNTVDAPGNSSVQFKNDPLNVVIKDNDNEYSPGGEDIDNDVLTYQQIAPMVGVNQFIGFKSPFSLQNPITSPRQLIIDSNTGSFSILPTELDSSYIVYKVTETRNGKVIGSAMRDMRIEVASTSSPQPSLTGINGSDIYSVDKPVCNDNDLIFTVSGYSPLNSPLNISLATQIEGVSFIQTKGYINTVSGILRFRPTKSGIFIISLKLTDSNCPIQGYDIKNYVVTVLGIPQVKYSVPKSNTWEDCSKPINQTISTTITGGKTPYVYEWYSSEKSGKQSSSSSYTVKEPGQYYFRVTDKNGCFRADTISFNTSLRVYYTAPYDSICVGNEIKFTNWTTNVDPTKKIQIQSMSFEDSSIVFSQNGPNPKNFLHTFSTPGVYNVRLTVTATDGCKQSFSKLIRAYGIPFANFTVIGNACQFPGETNLLSTTTIQGASVDELSEVFRYDDAELAGNQAKIRYKDKILIVTLTSSIKSCSSSYTQTITVNSKPIFRSVPASFAPRCNQISNGDTVLVARGIRSGNFSKNLSKVKYKWEILSSGDTSFKFKIDSTFLYKIGNLQSDQNLKITIRDTLMCINDTNIVIIDSLKPSFILPNNFCSENANISGQDQTIARTPLMYYSWDFDNGQTCTGVNATCTGINGTFTPSFTGINASKKVFNPILIVQDKWACIDTFPGRYYRILIDTTTFGVLKNGVNTNEFCNGDVVSLQSAVPFDPKINNINYWIWDYDDNKKDTLITPREFTIAGLNNSRNFDYAPDTVYTNTDFNYFHIYTVPGAKKIKLHIGFNTNYGRYNKTDFLSPYQTINSPSYNQECRITLQKDIIVYPKLIYKIDSTSINKCAGVLTEFNAKRISGIFNVEPQNFAWRFYKREFDDFLKPNLTQITSAVGLAGIDTTNIKRTFYTHGSKLPWYGKNDTYVVVLAVKDTKGCTNVDSIPFDNIKIFNSYLTSQKAQCQNKPVIFDLIDEIGITSDSTSHIWNFGDNTPVVFSGRTTAHTYKPSKVNQYKIVTQVFGSPTYGYNKCFVYDTLAYTNSYAPTANFEINKGAICFGDTIKITPKVVSNNDPDSLNIKYFWKFSEKNTIDSVSKSAYSYKFNTTGNQSIRLITQNSIKCADTVSKSINVYYKPKADFIFNSIEPSDEESVFSLTPINFKDISDDKATNVETVPSSTLVRKWTWGNDSVTFTKKALDTNVTYLEPKIYFVKLLLKNSELCTDSIKKKLDLTAFISDYPNAFSPNNKGDQLNERFMPYMNGIRKLEDFKIYNRYGQIVFESKNPKQGWDGKYNGIDQPIGTYIYYIKAQTGYNEVIEKNGKVTLIR